MTPVSEINAAKTHCPRGHAYADHGRVTVRGFRVCRICKRASARAWRSKHKEHVAAYMRGKRAAGGELRAKELARAKVGKAIARGKLVRPETCSNCDERGPVEAHHADYSKPLEVQWLCPPCHRAEHDQSVLVERGAGGSKVVL